MMMEKKKREAKKDFSKNTQKNKEAEKDLFGNIILFLKVLF